jgi:sulfite reductase alpha subunit-like flavoprotein
LGKYAIPFAAGDHVAVLPHSRWSPQCDDLCDALNIDPDAVFKLSQTEPSEFFKERHPLAHHLLGRYVTMRDVLCRRVGLDDLMTQVACASLKEYAHGGDVSILDRAGSDPDEYRVLCDSMDLVWRDIFTKLPSLKGSLPIERFLLHAPKIRPRLYSIASSPMVNAECIDVIVSRRADADARMLAHAEARANPARGQTLTTD